MADGGDIERIVREAQIERIVRAGARASSTAASGRPPSDAPARRDAGELVLDGTSRQPGRHWKIGWTECRAWSCRAARSSRRRPATSCEQRNVAIASAMPRRQSSDGTASSLVIGVADTTLRPGGAGRSCWRATGSQLERLSARRADRRGRRELCEHVSGWDGLGVAADRAGRRPRCAWPIDSAACGRPRRSDRGESATAVAIDRGELAGRRSRRPKRVRTAADGAAARRRPAASRARRHLTRLD